MIVIVRKKNIMLIGLAFLLLMAIYSLNPGVNEATAVTGEKEEMKVVIIDPGHGGEDPGTVSDYSGLREKDINLKVALKVKKLLENGNYRVIMTREEDRLEYHPDTTNVVEKRRQDLTRRKKIMDESGANIVVSIHMNKFQEPQYYGAQTFYPPNSPESQKLAVSIQKAFQKIADPTNKRQSLVKKDPIIILRDLKTTTALVECGFLSNSEEEKKLATDEYQDKLAQAIKAGIDDYFK